MGLLQLFGGETVCCFTSELCNQMNSRKDRHADILTSTLSNLSAPVCNEHRNWTFLLLLKYECAMMVQCCWTSNWEITGSELTQFTACSLQQIANLLSSSGKLCSVKFTDFYPTNLVCCCFLSFLTTVHRVTVFLEIPGKVGEWKEVVEMTEKLWRKFCGHPAYVVVESVRVLRVTSICTLYTVELCICIIIMNVTLMCVVFCYASVVISNFSDEYS